ALVALAITASGADAQNLSSCTVAGQNRYVNDVMRDIYFWNTELPTVNPTSYSSPEALLDALRYRPLDEHFSYIGARASEEAFYSDSQFVGFGYGSAFDGQGLKILQVFPDSPASEAGLQRGDRIVSIEGQSVVALATSGALGNALGPSQEGFGMSFRYERLDGSRADARMVKRPVTIPTVSYLNVHDVDGRKVGYLFFRNFVEPSRAALSEAFDALRSVGATELVLDLRYNGGGLVSIAQHLASLIGGARTDGQVFAEYFHNARNASRNQTTRFEGKSNSLNLQRLVVITTRSSASASELVINALRPFIPVTTVGEPSYGKPVGQYGITFCDKVLYPVSFTLRNANGQGDFFGGIPADCAAADDADRQLGDAQEASLAEALHVIGTGQCSATVATEPMRRANRVRADLQPRSGLDQLIGAH
ncbi:MAG TPA: S41 family peptidase, partial [Luteitalea sp.]|nr:S41 family peptidase [Luteitalea sp.]